MSVAPIWFNSPYRIISRAMYHAGYLAKGEEPASEDLALYMNDLNDLSNTWQTQGLKLWLNQDLSITPISGQALYVLGPGSTAGLAMTKPLRQIDGYYVDQSFNRRPVTPISRQEWDSLSTVTQTGTITSYFVDKQQLSLNIYLWLTPDDEAATGVMHAVLQQQVANVAAITDQMNFPVEWFLALIWGLADQICTGQPQAIMTRCANNAAMYRQMLEDWDVEDASTMIQPDQRSFSQTGQFQ